MKTTHRRLLQAAVIGASAIVLANCKWHKSDPPAAQTPVTVIKLSKHDVPIVKEYIGVTKSIASVDIRARVAGFLTKMDFVEGSPVKKGQLLFVIDPRPFVAKLELAQGQLSQSVANQEYLQVEYMRQKVLVAKGDTPKSTYDEANSQYRAAIGSVQSDTASVEDAKINLGYCSMYSPIDGIIGQKYVDVGNLVGSSDSTLLATVVALNPIYIEFSPSVADYGEFLNYRDNMPFKIEASMPQEDKDVFHGKLNLINNQADVGTSTILMRAIMDNPSNLLLPGIYVNVKVTLTEKNPVLRLPKVAVMETQGQRSVYVVGEGNKLQAKVINTSGSQGQDYLIRTGLKEGELVVVSGLQKLRPGMEVTTTLADNKD